MVLVGEIEDDVFCAATDFEDPDVVGVFNFSGDGPAEAIIADLDGGNGFAGEIGFDASAGGFYFGEFGHGSGYNS